MGNEVIPSRDFDEVAQMIAAAKQRTYSAVNSMLVELYWQVGAYIHNNRVCRLGRGCRRSTGQVPQNDVARPAWIYAAKLISDAAILRDLSGR